MPAFSGLNISGIRLKISSTGSPAGALAPSALAIAAAFFMSKQVANFIRSPMLSALILPPMNACCALVLPLTVPRSVSALSYEMVHLAASGLPLVVVHWPPATDTVHEPVPTMSKWSTDAQSPARSGMKSAGMRLKTSSQSSAGEAPAAAGAAAGAASLGRAEIWPIFSASVICESND